MPWTFSNHAASGPGGNQPFSFTRSISVPSIGSNCFLYVSITARGSLPGPFIGSVYYGASAPTAIMTPLLSSLTADTCVQGEKIGQAHFYASLTALGSYTVYVNANFGSPSIVELLFAATAYCNVRNAAVLGSSVGAGTAQLDVSGYTNGDGVAIQAFAGCVQRGAVAPRETYTELNSEFYALFLSLVWLLCCDIIHSVLS
jgi:hypothetical protein